MKRKPSTNRQENIKGLKKVAYHIERMMLAVAPEDRKHYLDALKLTLDTIGKLKKT
jgi:hypothetical protein